MYEITELIRRIKKRKLEDHYNTMLSYASIHGVKLQPLEEIEMMSEESSFDKKTDDLLEKFALEAVEKKRKEYGRK